MFISKRFNIWITLLLTWLMLVSPGCFWINRNRDQSLRDVDYEQYKSAATAIEYPDVESCEFDDQASTLRPRTLADLEPTEFWELTLEECMHLSLQNSQVLRDIGGAVLTSPDTVQTLQNPALVETDPRFGVEAALSAFDAAWSTRAFFEKNDRGINNQFFGGGTRVFQQDLLDYTSELSKVTATGANLSVRHNAQYDFNNSPGNNNPNLPWGTNFEVEVRQPVLQGNGVRFNRIAGPAGTPGVYNGVMIARINSDITLADFQMALRNLVFDIETAYWELYFAYRDVDAKIAARDRALETWRIVNSLKDQVGADEEAQAREQYYRLEDDVQNALNGRLQEKARVSTFRGTAGVYDNERRLRLLMGLQINDGRLIRPKDEPVMARVVFDWNEVLVEGLMRRTELRRQKWRIKQRELELVASRNFLLPRLDTIGRYRWRGIGHDLITHSNETDLDSAFDNLLSGAFQEWQLGFELSFSAGARQAHAAVRNAQLQLAREHAMLHEQEREVTHDLSNAIGELERAYVSAKLNYNRRLAARQQLAALEAKARGDLRTQTRYLDLILDAQRRLADAESRYYRSITEYVMAIRLVHYNKGSLLDYNEIHMAEGPWPEQAYRDAARRERLRLRSWRLENFMLATPPPVSRGAIPQDVDSTFSEELPVEVLPTRESTSPVLPPPPDVLPSGGGRLPETAALESTRRGESPPSQPGIGNTTVVAARRQPSTDRLQPVATILERQTGDKSELMRIGQRLPFDDDFKQTESLDNASVLSGTLLDRREDVENQQLRPVVRFAATQPGQLRDVLPTEGDADAIGLHRNPRDGFNAVQRNAHIDHRSLETPRQPYLPQRPGTAVPATRAGQPFATRRSPVDHAHPPSARPTNPIDSFRERNRWTLERTGPVVRYLTTDAPSFSSDRLPGGPQYSHPAQPRNLPVPRHAATGLGTGWQVPPAHHPVQHATPSFGERLEQGSAVQPAAHTVLPTAPSQHPPQMKLPPRAAPLSPATGSKNFAPAPVINFVPLPARP